MFELSPIFVYDSAEIPNSTGGTYTVEMIKENDIYALTLTVDETWLSSATYPVTIDPTVTYNTDSGIEDASSAQNDPFINGSAFVFYVGNYGSSVARAYIRFPNLVIPPSAFSMITSANLHLKSQSVSMSPGISIEGYSINSSWTEDGYYASSFPYNNYKTSPMVSGGIGSYTSSHTFDVTNLVKDWGGTDSSIGAYRGILLKTSALNEASTYYAVFHSSEASNAADRPYLTITTSSVELPTTQQEGIRDNRFYWVSSGTSFITQPVNNTNTLSARDYTNTAQRLLFTYVGSGKYRISTEYSPTNYLTLNGNSLLFQAQSTSGNQLWYVGNTNGSSYYIINAADTTKSLTTNGTSVTCSTSSVTNWTFEKCPTFYGQNTSTLIDTNHQYWNPNNLDSVFFNYTSSSNPLFRETQTQDLMDSGCALVAYAMILDNLNLKALTYDFRDGETKLRNPDPFYITLANTNNLTSNVQSITVDSSIIYNYSTSYDVISARHNHIVQSYSPNLSSVSKENAVAQLKELVISHPEGVWVYFRRPDNSTHAIVFTEYIGGDSLDSTPENDFIVYDPAANYAYQGSGVVFSNCKTYIDENEAIAINKPLHVLTFDQMVEIRIVEEYQKS